MNRYLIAALYVMAGCAVTVPLKAQPGGGPLQGEKCRLVITHAVKVVSACMQEEETWQESYCLPPDYYHFPQIKIVRIRWEKDRPDGLYTGALCRISCKIRAPEKD